ncbi:MAG: DUF2807 domain-containing protein [Bacteroidetes bacterium]|mgnify:FL=1|nr:DUF2807 domain-containing protein [Bacteroidota bacterium]MBT6836557.1 DUF2807 domain-containing protein [Bacteroidota bacterium]MBT7041705.1 DUF2807 domain-containing protein [Bacteroidota bacterium]
MKKVIRTGFIVLGLSVIMLGLNSCYFDFLDCIRGNGNMDEESRELNEFDEVKQYGSFDVIVIQDTMSKVIISAEENILPYISTQVSHGALIIKSRDNHCLNPSRSVKITVYTPDISKLLLAGSGSMVSDSIVSNKFEAGITGSGFIRADVFATDVELNISGSGDMDVYLEADYLETNISGSGLMKLFGEIHDSENRITGSGDIKSLEMEQEISVVNITGSGSVWVDVSNTLDVNITGSGDVFYSGSPKIYSNITGSGNIIEL